MTDLGRQHDVAAMLSHSGLRAAGPARPRTGGSLSAVYEAPTDDGAVIVKVYAEQWRWKQRKEQHVYGLLAPVLGRQVPEVLDVQDESNPTGHAYTLLGLIPGRPLSEVGIDGSGWRAVHRQLGELTARMHAVDLPAFGYLVTTVIEPRTSNREYIVERLVRYTADFAARGGDAVLARRIGEVVRAHEHTLDRCTTPRLVHNDLHAGNLLVESARDGWVLRGIVDVENAVAGDPLLDLAKTEVYAVRRDDRGLDALLDGYGDIGAARDPRFTLYCIFHCLELWTWFAQIGRTDALDGLADQAAGYLQRLV